MVATNLLDPALYTNVRKPLLEAETLPAWCYTSPEFYAREMQTIFARCWSFAGREDEIPRAGDYLTLGGPSGPIIIVRGQDDRTRAFVNACRHRGTRLLTNSGNCKTIVCPYHSWSYALDGALRRTPGMDGVLNFNREEYGLTPVRLETWDGFMFVNTDPDSPPLMEHLGDMPERFADYRFSEMKCVRRVDFSIGSNWKLLIENALEAYHTGTVHRDTLGRQTSEPVQSQGGWDALFIDGETSVAVLPGETTSLPHIPGLRDKQTRGTYFTVIYPCTQFAIAQDCMWWMDIQPDGPNRCRMTLGSCFPESSTRLPEFETLVQHYYQRWDSTTPEDNVIAQEQQAGQGSPLRSPGRYSAEEFAVYNLNNWVLDQVLESG